MADQPTPPNLGNLTPAEFLALQDWAVQATNQLDAAGEETPDTFEKMTSCVVALLYRLIRDNFAYENDAWACRVSTPLLEKINALIAAVQWRATDNDAQALTSTLLDSFAVVLPDLLFNCNGVVLDDIGGSVSLINVDGPATPAEVYHVVSARGTPSVPGDVIYGLRVTQNRHYYTDVHTTAMEGRFTSFSANVTLQWPEDSSIGSKVIIAKVSDYLTSTEIGATKRLGFEFGLQAVDIGTDAAAHGTDMVMYVRWRDDVDAEVIAFATVGAGHVGISPGREITLGFAKNFDEVAGNVRFYVNGVLISTTIDLGPSVPGTDSDMRLLVGADFDGSGWVGGPINNVYYKSGTTDDSAVDDATMHAIYRIGTGALQGP